MFRGLSIKRARLASNLAPGVQSTKRLSHISMINFGVSVHSYVSNLISSLQNTFRGFFKKNLKVFITDEFILVMFAFKFEVRTLADKYIGA